MSKYVALAVEDDTNIPHECTQNELESDKMNEVAAYLNQEKFNECSESEIDEDILNTTADSALSQLLQLLLKRTIPICGSAVFYFLGSFITVCYAGRLNDDKIFAGLSLASMFINVSLMSILNGMSSAIDTLGSQYYGAGNYKEVGLVFQRSCVICTLVSIPLVALWFFSRTIFIQIGIDENVSTVAQNYLLVRLTSVPIDIILISLEKYTSSVGVVMPPLYANITHNVVLAVCGYVFLYINRYSYLFIGWSWAIASLASCIVMLSTAYLHPAIQRTLQPPSWDAFRKWGEFISLGFPSTVMICSEWWAWELLTLIASTLGPSEVAASTIMYQTSYLSYMIPMGLGEAVRSIIGNFIGAGKYDVAMKFGRMGLILALCTQSCLGICIYFFGHLFVSIYTSDQSILELCFQLLPFFSFFIIVDGQVAVSQGILGGVGKQAFGSIANMISYYGIALPVEWYLSHTSLAVKGLVYGYSIGTVCQAVILLSMIFLKQESLYRPTIDTTTTQVQRPVEEPSITTDSMQQQQLRFGRGADYDEENDDMQNIEFLSSVKDEDNGLP